MCSKPPPPPRADDLNFLSVVRCKLADRAGIRAKDAAAYLESMLVADAESAASVLSRRSRRGDAGLQRTAVARCRELAAGIRSGQAAPRVHRQDAPQTRTDLPWQDWANQSYLRQLAKKHQGGLQARGNYAPELCTRGLVALQQAHQQAEGLAFYVSYSMIFFFIPVLLLLILIISRFFLSQSCCCCCCCCRNGQEWLHYRRILNKIMLRPDSSKLMSKPCEEAAQDLVKKWKESEKRVVPDLESQLYQWSIEGNYSQ